MTDLNDNGPRNSGVPSNTKQKSLLTTKQLPELTGLSASYFEKGRSQGYGPPFIKIKSGNNKGRVLYRRAALEEWLHSQEHDPEGGDNA